MPINYPSIPIEKVPIPRPVTPPELPPFKDASDIILTAARLNQEREEFQQKKVNDLTNTLLTAASLMEKREESKSRTEHSKALLELQKELNDKRMEEINAKIPLIKSNAEYQEKLNRGELKPTVEQIGGPGGPTVIKSPERGGIRFKQVPLARDLDRPLNLSEQQAYGAPAGTIFRDVMGMIPVSPVNREKIVSIDNTIPLITSLRELVEKLDLADTVTGAPARSAILNSQALFPSTAAGQFKTARQNISFIVREMGEKGVLTDTDRAVIANDLTSFGDTKQSSRERLDRISSVLTTRKYILQYGLSGNIFSKDGSKRPLKDFLQDNKQGDPNTVKAVAKHLINLGYLSSK